MRITTCVFIKSTADETMKPEKTYMQLGDWDLLTCQTVYHSCQLLIAAGLERFKKLHIWKII